MAMLMHSLFGDARHELSSTGFFSPKSVGGQDGRLASSLGRSARTERRLAKSIGLLRGCNDVTSDSEAITAPAQLVSRPWGSRTADAALRRRSAPPSRPSRGDSALRAVIDLVQSVDRTASSGKEQLKRLQGAWQDALESSFSDEASAAEEIHQLSPQTKSRFQRGKALKRSGHRLRKSLACRASAPSLRCISKMEPGPCEPLFGKSQDVPSTQTTAQPTHDDGAISEEVEELIKEDTDDVGHSECILPPNRGGVSAKTLDIGEVPGAARSLEPPEGTSLSAHRQEGRDLCLDTSNRFVEEPLEDCTGFEAQKTTSEDNVLNLFGLECENDEDDLNFFRFIIPPRLDEALHTPKATAGERVGDASMGMEANPDHFALQEWGDEADDENDLPFFHYDFVALRRVRACSESGLPSPKADRRAPRTP